MAGRRARTIAEYIAAAPEAGKPHLKRLRAILKEVAPKAQETLKWNTPFFIEPRYLFAYSAHKAHVSFSSSNDALAPYRDKLEGYEITKMGIIKIPYNKPIPENLIRKIAKARLKIVGDRDDDNFW